MVDVDSPVLEELVAEALCNRADRLIEKARLLVNALPYYYILTDGVNAWYHTLSMTDYGHTPSFGISKLDMPHMRVYQSKTKKSAEEYLHYLQTADVGTGLGSNKMNWYVKRINK